MGALIGEAAAYLGNQFTQKVTSRIANRAVAAQVERYAGSRSDFAMGFVSRASGASLPSGSTGAPSATGAVGEVMGAYTNGMMRSGANYATTQRAAYNANGAGAGSADDFLNRLGVDEFGQ